MNVENGNNEEGRGNCYYYYELDQAGTVPFSVIIISLTLSVYMKAKVGTKFW